MALDFATTTGWSIWEDGSMHSGFVSFAAKGKANRDSRLLAFRNWLNANATGVDCIAYEAVRNLKNANALICLAELQAVLKMFSLEHGIELHPYSAKEIKKHITGNGNASKDMVMEAVNTKFNLSIKDDNESDSIALLSLALQKKFPDSVSFRESGN